MQGRHSAKAIHKLSVDSHALSMHRSRVLVHGRFPLPAYTRVTNFLLDFHRGNGGRLIRRTAYTRVYTVFVLVVDTVIGSLSDTAELVAWKALKDTGRNFSVDSC